MISARFWDEVASRTLFVLLLAVGLFPPHVHPPLLPALALSALLITLGLLGSGRLPSPRAGVAVPLMTACALAVLSAATALEPVSSVRLLAAWFAGGVVFAAARTSAGEREARRTAAAVALLATLLGGLGVYQSLVAFPAVGESPVRVGSAAPESGADAPPRAEGSQAAGSDAAGRKREAEEARVRSGRAVGTVGIPASLASLFLLGVPLAAAAAADSTGPMRMAWSMAAALQMAALVATRSVGAAAALLVAAAICAPLWVERRSALRISLLAAALVAAALAAGPRLTAGGEGSLLRSVGERAANWKAGFSMLASHPLLGVGPDNYGVAFSGHRTWAGNETRHAHNSYLEVASDMGLPILPFAAIALAGLIGAAVRVSRRDGAAADARWRGRALAVGCLAWAAQNVVDFTGYIAASSVPFLAAAGLLVREARAFRDGGTDPPAPPAGIPARALLLAAALLAVFVTIPDAVSGPELEKAVGAASHGDFEEAAAHARRAALWNPFDPEPRVMIARSLMDEALRLEDHSLQSPGSLAEALAEAEEAVRLDPATANRRAVLAMARATVGDVAGAYAAMAAAARLNAFRESYAADRDRLRAILTAESREPSERGGVPAEPAHPPPGGKP